ncbi:hypothetical protein C8J30_101232 [Rhodobacter viridis]|uniref:Urease accessory protein UreE C-terminal domain-containing protein n=1 Tax=Rhodobacter viridis TaxID=1054202 RepID=A0A318UAB4_9RHOB|nr:hypothetical protein [Rhodobacter viridis]PYF12851.1 hypothetical protein C8J30_101232 [Rhodobacter viridis]
MSQETLTEVRGDLVLAALCVGQFRAPCQIEAERLLVRADEALMQALRALGLDTTAVFEAFTPAPLFAPDDVILDQVARGIIRRQVTTHVFRPHDDETAEEDSDSVVAAV